MNDKVIENKRLCVEYWREKETAHLQWYLNYTTSMYSQRHKRFYAKLALDERCDEYGQSS